MRKVFADGFVTLRTFDEDRVPSGPKKNAKQCAEPTRAGFLTQAECRILAHSGVLRPLLDIPSAKGTNRRVFVDLFLTVRALHHAHHLQTILLFLSRRNFRRVIVIPHFEQVLGDSSLSRFIVSFPSASSDTKYT